ncbi:DUF6481 family protein, partial [Sphingomonas sp.]|uniref:DUF6481 family protein n=1 Tax=Sphingomonas sp. TaxID=28214 RepID=UPI003B3A91E3
MAGFKTPDFNERAAAGRASKEAALAKLRAKPKPDPAVVAERQAAQAARDAAAAERREARARAIAEEKAAKAAAREEKAAKAAAAVKPKLSAEELKAARDARYAAR